MKITRPYLLGESIIVGLLAGFMTLKSLQPPSPISVPSSTEKVEKMHYYLPCYQYRSLTAYYFGTPQTSKEGALAQIQAAQNIVSAFVIEFDLPALPKPENQ